MINWLKKYRSWLSIAVRYLIGFIIVAWLLHSDHISLKALDQINIRTATIATVLVFIHLFLSAWRVQLLLDEHDIPVGIWHCNTYNSIGVFYSLFLPGAMSGDLARAYCFWRASPGASKSALFGALFIDRLLGMTTMVLLGLVAGTFLMATLGLQQYVIASWIGFVMLGASYFFVVRLHHKGDKTQDGIFGRLLRFTEKIDLQGYSVRTLGICSVLSLAGHLCAVLTIYLFSDLLHSGLSFLQIVAVAPFGLLANALPLTPGGLGIGEKGFDLLYAMIGGSQGGNSFLLSRIFLFAPAILGAIVLGYLFIKSHKSIFSEGSLEE